MLRIRKILRLIASPRLGLALLVLTFVLLIVGINPQVMALYQYPGEFFQNKLSLVVLIAFFINLLFCTLKQITLLRRRNKRLPAIEPLHQNEPASAIFSNQPGDFPVQVTDYLKQKGFRYRFGGDGFMTFSKHGFGSWGSIIFHLGLLAICLGAFLEITLAFTGRIGLVAGQLFEHRWQGYSYIEKNPWYRPPEGSFSLYLHEIKAKYNKNGVFAAADLSLLNKDTEITRQEVAAGEPLSYGLWNFYFENFGYYLQTRVTTGTREYPFNIGLNTLTGAAAETYRDNFDLAGTPYHLDLEFIPNLSMAGQAQEQAYLPVQPAVRLIVDKKENNQVKRIYQQIVSLGQTAVINEDTKITLEGFYPWVSLKAKWEPGLYLIYFGFVISILGLLLIYFWVPESIQLQISPGNAPGNTAQIRLTGWKPRYQKEYQQWLITLQAELEELLGKGN